MRVIFSCIAHDDESIFACRCLLSLNPWAKYDVLLNQLIGRRLARIQQIKLNSAAESSAIEYNSAKKGRVIVTVGENDDALISDQDDMSSVKSTSSNDSNDWTKS